MTIPDNLTPAQAEALDDLFHNCDLISTRPAQHEIDWTLERAGREEAGL